MNISSKKRNLLSTLFLLEGQRTHFIDGMVAIFLASREEMTHNVVG